MRKFHTILDAAAADGIGTPCRVADYDKVMLAFVLAPRVETED